MRTWVFSSLPFFVVISLWRVNRTVYITCSSGNYSWILPVSFLSIFIFLLSLIFSSFFWGVVVVCVPPIFQLNFINRFFLNSVFSWLDRFVSIWCYTFCYMYIFINILRWTIEIYIRFYHFDIYNSFTSLWYGNETIAITITAATIKQITEWYYK